MRHGAMTVEGRKVSADWVNQILDEELASFKKVCVGGGGEARLLGFGSCRLLVLGVGRC